MRYLRSVAGAAVALVLACGDSTDPQQFAILTAVSGDGQETASLDTLSEELVVRAVDGNGDPVAGLELAWSTDDHEGAALIPVSATTDAQGEARARWVLGIGSGAQTVSVRVPGSTFSVGFTAEALPGLQLATMMKTSEAGRVCGLDADGAAWCWDGPAAGNVESPVRVGADLTFTSLSGMYGTFCGIGTDLATYCWGQTVRLGVQNSPEPTKLPFPLQFASISLEWNSNGYQACGVTLDADAYCWGRGVMGDGDPNVRDANEPRLVAGGLKWLSVVRGFTRTCGVTELYEVRCWGEDGAEDNGSNLEWYGIDQPGVLGAPANVPLVADATQIALGHDNACAVTDAGALCWGHPPLGDASALAAPGPGHPGNGYLAVSGNRDSYFALSADGHIDMWGAESPTAIRLAGDGPWRAPTSAFNTGLCAILESDGAVYCWPELTDAPGATSNLPRPVPAPAAP
ncbi:MAG TPA: Ig-like domain-containing protein [Gemmatimonadales bacterium]|nr:Ig-like domain-containing protein [Gemmatimonadales bacterium]